MQGFRVGLTMAEAVLSFQSVQHRHAIPTPTLTRPWAKRPGPGILGLSIKLHRGSVLGLVGPNGAGKTTLLRMMAGVLPLQEGRVQARFEGEDWTDIADCVVGLGTCPNRYDGRAEPRFERP